MKLSLDRLKITNDLECQPKRLTTLSMFTSGNCGICETIWWLLVVATMYGPWEFENDARYTRPQICKPT